MTAPGTVVILAALKRHGPMTAHQIAEVTGLSYRTLYNSKTEYLGALRSARKIYVCEWRRQAGHGGAPVPVFAVGKYADEPRPAPKTTEQKNREAEIRVRLKKPASVIATVLGLSKPKAAPAKSDTARMLGL